MKPRASETIVTTRMTSPKGFVKNCLDSLINSPVVKTFFKPLIGGKIEKRQFDNESTQTESVEKIESGNLFEQKSKQRRIAYDVEEINTGNSLNKQNNVERYKPITNASTFRKANEKYYNSSDGRKKQSLWLNSSSVALLSKDKPLSISKSSSIQADNSIVLENIPVKSDLNIFYPGKTVFGGASSRNTFSIPKKSTILNSNKPIIKQNIDSKQLNQSSSLISGNKIVEPTKSSYVTNKIQKILDDANQMNKINSPVLESTKYSPSFKFEPITAPENNIFKFSNEDKNDLFKFSDAKLNSKDISNKVENIIQSNIFPINNMGDNHFKMFGNNNSIMNESNIQNQTNTISLPSIPIDSGFIPVEVKHKIDENEHLTHKLELFFEKPIILTDCSNILKASNMIFDFAKPICQEKNKQNFNSNIEDKKIVNENAKVFENESNANMTYNSVDVKSYTFTEPRKLGAHSYELNLLPPSMFFAFSKPLVLC